MRNTLTRCYWVHFVTPLDRGGWRSYGRHVHTVSDLQAAESVEQLTGRSDLLVDECDAPIGTCSHPTAVPLSALAAMGTFR